MFCPPSTTHRSQSGYVRFSLDHSYIYRYRLLCAERGIDPISTYAELAEKHQSSRPRGPFIYEARRAAGFDHEELASLDAGSRGNRLCLTEAAVIPLCIPPDSRDTAIL